MRVTGPAVMSAVSKSWNSDVPSPNRQTGTIRYPSPSGASPERGTNVASKTAVWTSSDTSHRSSAPVRTLRRTSVSIRMPSSLRCPPTRNPHS